ncbi:MAG TPA: Ig-like domain-containing protein [Gemmatimonadota bacterium]|nr:Ig-like domain-containing protein [Gemmatimonadota bacterium]
MTGHRAAAGMSLVVLLAACASEGFPPGGPEDLAAPVLIETDPAHRAVNATPGQAITLTFDEVIDDRQLGELRGIVRMNPDDPEYDLELDENVITLVPDAPLHEDLTYSVTVLPGIRDREGNASVRPQSILFSVGGRVPITLSVVRATILDEAGAPAIGALYRIENTATEFGYTMTADSQGEIEAEAVAYGPYVATAWIERVRPDGWEMTEEPGARDTFELSEASRAYEATYRIAVVDTTAPIVTAVTTPEARLLRVTVDDAIPEGIELTPSGIAVYEAAPDVDPEAEPDSIALGRQRFRRIGVVRAVRAGPNEIQVETAWPLERGHVHRVELIGLRNASGVAATPEGGLPFRPEYEGPVVYPSEPLPWPGPAP